MPTGAGLRPGAKAPEEPPDPTGGAPALDPTDERRLETESWRGVRHRQRRKPPVTATPSAYRHRASRRLYTNLVGTLGLETSDTEADPPSRRGRLPAVGKRATGAPTGSAGVMATARVDEGDGRNTGSPAGGVARANRQPARVRSGRAGWRRGP